jgi:flagellin-like protein
MIGNQLLKRRRGISQLLAVIITIGIVIALGALLYAWTIGLFKTGGAVAELTVVDASIVKSSGNNPDATFSITVKNTGTVTATSISISETSGNLNDKGGSALSVSFTNLAPGKSTSKTASLDPTSVDVGKTYLIKIDVSFADGSTKSFTVSVRAQEV